MKIYTKKGDRGKTDLIKKRVKKNDSKIHLVGELDELAVRMAELNYYLKGNFKDEIKVIDKVLFKVATLVIDVENTYNLEVTDEEIKYLENKIDLMEKEVPKLTKFITYDGTLEAIKASLVKTQVRKVDRLLLAEELKENVLTFLNRLSDYFFVLARYLNHLEKVEERKREL